jgi:glycosyltransferase involved in cell wall biosynthesis
VIIPNYNYGRFLRETIESVLSQTYPSFEIVVVDDGSTDESLEILRTYGERVRVLTQRNQGVSAARNHGISESRGDFVALLDADDVWLPTKLTQQMRLFDQAQVGMVYCGLRYVDTTGKPLYDRCDGESGNVLTAMTLLRGSGVPASGSSALLRRACFERTGLFDEKLTTAADWDMWRRVACHYEIRFVPQPLVLYRQHQNAMHWNVGRLEHDMQLALDKLFSDPAATRVHALRRTSYANLYATLAGSYFHTRRYVRCLHSAWRSLLWSPRVILEMAAFPWRWLQRRLGWRTDDPLMY